MLNNNIKTQNLMDDFFQEYQEIKNEELNDKGSVTQEILEKNLEFEALSPYKVLPVRKVEQFRFDGSNLFITGFAYFDGLVDLDENKIEHSILVVKKAPEIVNNPEYDEDGRFTGKFKKIKTGNIVNVPVFEKKTLRIVPEETPNLELENLPIELQNHIEKISNNYHYQVNINFDTMTEGHPLTAGDYEIYIRLKQFVDDRWVGHDFPVGRIENINSDYVYTTKLHWYEAKKVTTYSFVTKQELGSESVQLRINKLSTVNPSDLIVRDDAEEPELKKITHIKKAVFRLSYLIFKLLPVKRNRVSFLSDSRRDLTGNFEFIFEEINKLDNMFDSKFYFKLTNNEPKSLIQYIQLAKAIATSRFVLLDDFYPLIYPLKIRKGVDLIQVWHAVGAFKTFGFSRLGMPGGPKITSKNHRNYTYAIVSSSAVASNYAEGFGIDENRLLPLGAPRTDIFFNEDKKRHIINKLKEEMSFINGKKVILFAPTFRGNGQQSAYYPFDWIDYEQLYKEFSKKGFVFLFKIHPFVKNSPDIPYEYSDFFYDVSDYREVNDLLLISDVMITDYSSVVFEYSLLKKKTIFFAPDLTEYMISRSFYVDYLNFIPGPHVVNMNQLINEISRYNQVDIEKINLFLNYYFEDLDGKSSKRFVDFLISEMQGTAELNDNSKNDLTVDGKLLPKWGKKIDN